MILEILNKTFKIKDNFRINNLIITLDLINKRVLNFKQYMNNKQKMYLIQMYFKKQVKNLVILKLIKIMRIF
jgi:hypothetical protein